jgi:hypothetical protein
MRKFVKKKNTTEKIELEKDMYSTYFSIEDHIKHLGRNGWSLGDYNKWLYHRFNRSKEYFKDYRTKFETKNKSQEYDEGKIIIFEN